MIPIIRLDCRNLRKERQLLNNLSSFRSLISGDKIAIKNNCNMKEIGRVLEYRDMNLKEMIKRCKKDEEYCHILSILVSKKASRQGVKDEIVQLDACAEIAKLCNMKLTKLGTNEVRATKDGIITKDKDVDKMECLKSFDAKIKIGDKIGWITSKIVYDSGGHQDNVFRELRDFCDWARVFGDKTKNIFIALVDTNLDKEIQELKSSYKRYSHIWIENHITFQKRLIKSFQQMSNNIKS